MDKKKKLSSKQVRGKLKIRSCELMHLREDGVLRAEKKGRAYLYNEDDVDNYLELEKRKQNHEEN